MTATKALLIGEETSLVGGLWDPLIQRGASVLRAMDGSDALEILAKDLTVDAVVLDIEAGADALETVKAVKIGFPLVEVIILTGCATIGAAIEGLKLGALDYIVRPIQLEALWAKLQEAKTKKRQHEGKIDEALATQIALSSAE
jgi:DNA-binding response OmpR family regulator